MRWFIIVIEELSCPDSYIWNPIKVQSENEISAIDFVENFLLGKGISKEQQKERFEIINLFDCGDFEPVDLMR